MLFPLINEVVWTDIVKHDLGRGERECVQLRTVMDMARLLPVEKRDLYLQRIAAMLTMRGGQLTDSDVAEVVKLALAGLVQQAANSAA